MSASDPRSFNLPDLQCLQPDQIDNLGRALLTLAREVAVLTDRVLVLEDLLAKQGTLPEGAVDVHQPDDALAERSAKAIGAIVTSVLASIQGADGSE